MSARELITENLDLWGGAVTRKSSSGRGSNGKAEMTGVKKLRELILELAVRGKLLNQDEGDEPALALLARIKDVEKGLVKSKRIREPKHVNSVSTEEAEFALPDSWQWVRLGTIGQIVGGGTPKSGEQSYWSDKGIPWLTPADLYGLKEKYIASGARDISELGLAKSSAQLLPAGSVLFSSRAPIGYVAIATGELATNQGFKSCVPYIQEMNQFIYYFLKRSAPYIDASASGTTFKEISGTKVASIPMPLPPLEEQHRIVQKVDELMALCDRLEKQASDQLEAHEALVDTLLSTLTQSENATDLADNWARLATHFDTLFTTEQSIEKLKQTILQLAVMGRLVEQDAEDETALKFLARIEAKKAQLDEEKRRRQSKPLPPIDQSDEPFALPSGWTLTRLDDITDIQGGIAKGKKIVGRKKALPYLRVANVQRSLLELTEIKEIEIAEEDVERYLVKPRDLLITEGGDWDKVGRTAIWDGSIDPMAHQNHVFRARLILDDQNEKWLERYLNSPFAREYFAGSSKQTTNLASINKTQLRSCVIPLPPLEEQSRIIRKLDELMAICNLLKKNMIQAAETRCQMADAIVEGALD